MQPLANELSKAIMNERRREAEQQRLAASFRGSEDGGRLGWIARIARTRRTTRPVQRVALR